MAKKKKKAEIRQADIVQKKPRTVNPKTAQRARERLLSPEKVGFKVPLAFAVSLLAIARRHPKEMRPYAQDIRDMNNQVAKRLR